MHLLLDTNILINLVKEPRDASLLDDLVKLKETGIIEILAPKTLLKEWNQKKEQTLNEIRKYFFTAGDLSHNENIPMQLQDELEIAREKVARIDQLLAAGIQITPSEMVKVEIVDRSSARKAPFHGERSKRSSIDDALIYFSTIEYLQKKEISEFLFVTNNFSDFSCSIKKGENLHPDLFVEDLTVHYFLSLRKCFHVFKDVLKLPELKAVTVSEPKFLIRVAKEGTKSLLAHLAEVLRLCKEKMPFIPPDILCRVHPFRVENWQHTYTYYAGFTLFTNNEALMDLFLEVDTEKMQFIEGAAYQNTKENLILLRFILERLNDQLVFAVSYVSGGEEVSIRKPREQQGSGLVATYQTLRWDKIFKEQVTEEDSVQKGFVQFQLGNYGAALDSYYSSYQKAKKTGNKIQYFRLLYCLKWVADYAFLNKEENTDELLQEVKAFDLDQEYFGFAGLDQLDRELARFLYSGNMLQHFAGNVREVADKIREHYESQLRGGYSNNSNYSNLLTAFAVFETFTTVNGLPYTRYSDFEAIGKDFAEGLLLCTVLNKHQGSRLLHLDDVLLELLLFYGDAEHLIRFYNRYIKKRLTYKSEAQYFLQLAENFLTQNKETIRRVSEADHGELSHRFYRIFWNLLLLISVVKFDEEYIHSLPPKLLPFLAQLPRGESTSLNHFSSFIHSNGKVLGQAPLKELFLFCLDTPTLHQDSVFSAFAELNKEHPPVFITTKKAFEQFYSLTVEKCPKCGQYHHSILYYSYKHLSAPYQRRLSELIQQKLVQELDPDLYYKAALFDVIDYKTLFQEYLKLFKSPREADRRPSFFMSGEITHRGLNDLMNLVFKNKIKLPRTFIQQFKGISDYYDWLVDMQHYDYDRFDPQWIVQHPTRHYLEHIFSLPVVRDKVRSYLRKNHNPTLANYYSQHVR